MLDPELAAAPLKYLLQCMQCSIGPALKVDGADFDDDVDQMDDDSDQDGEGRPLNR